MLVGRLIVKLCGPARWAAATAVGLAMGAMHWSGTFHPPAGIDPLVVVVTICRGVFSSSGRYWRGVARIVCLCLAQPRRPRR